MSAEQFGGVLRAVLAWLAGFLPATVFDADTTAMIVGGLVTIGVALWSYYTKPRAPTPPAAPGA